MKAIVSTCIFLFLGIEVLIAQSPIMVVTCRGRNALVQENNGFRILERVNELYVTKKATQAKSLKAYGDFCDINPSFPTPCDPGYLCYTGDAFSSNTDGFCVPTPDISGNCPPGFEEGLDPFNLTLPLCIPIAPACLECANGLLSWSYTVEKFYCAGGGPDPFTITFPDPILNGDCDCPEGQVKVDDGNGNFNCALPFCFDTNISSNFECDGSGQVTVTLTPVNTAGVPIATGLPADAVITVDNLTNCEFSDPDAAALYNAANSAGNNVALNTLVFTVTLSGPGGASLSLPDLGVDIVIPDMNCPVITAEDPCSCTSTFNPTLGPVGLFQDELNVSGLIPGQIYLLQTNNGGFFNTSGVLFPLNSTFTANGSGEISQVFYRGPGESADIVLSTGDTDDVDVVFKSESPCPLIADCNSNLLNIDITDPCNCNSSFNNVTKLYTDELLVKGLIGGQNIFLQSNNEGFRNINGIDIAASTSFTADASGEVLFPFYKFEGETTDIVLRIPQPGGSPDLISSFTATFPCPYQSDCNAPTIPTLNQWGIITLSILLMILGVARIKSMEQDAIEKIL